MLVNPAQYLLRCDDLCPTMRAERWRELAALIAEFGLRPILAVVPENCDDELRVSPPDAGFWDEMRKLQTAGASIALHGYRHLCRSRGRSLVGYGRRSEFAGVAEETQRVWIQTGLRILREQGLDPKLWAAPRHGFDSETLRALRAEGIEVLSDGLEREPHVRAGMTWIPQQLWAPVEKCSGLWTICIHPNTASREDLESLRRFLERHAEQFTSVDRVLKELRPGRLGITERAYAKLTLWRMAARANRRVVPRGSSAAW